MANEPAEHEPEQGALFELEVDDDDGCVWLVTGEGDGTRAVNLGPRHAVAAKFRDWLALGPS